MNPFQQQAKEITKIYKNWKSINVKPYDKETVDPYTRVRVILMNGTEFESVWNSSRLTRQCANNDVRRAMALIRRGEQQQQKRIANLKPRNESMLEHTIGYEQLAVDLTAILARREKNEMVKNQLDFALLEDFDHLYRYADLLDFERGIHAEKLVGSYTEIMPGRPTVAEPRAPQDDVRGYINNFLSDPVTRLNINIITAAEQQTMNYYMNIANLYESELGRKLYSEIAMIEEQHVTGYGCLKDPAPDMFECMVMHEYTECYLYWSCYNDEMDARIKDIWLMHFEEELSHLHFACGLMERYEGRVWQQLFPEGGEFPALLQFKPQKEYVREVLKSVRLTGNGEGYEEVDKLPQNFRFFSYNRGVNGNSLGMASHAVIEKTINKFGRDYRVEDKPHPVRALSDAKKDNTDVARIQGA